MKEVKTELKMVATAELDKQIEKELKREDPKETSMAKLVENNDNN